MRRKTAAAFVALVGLVAAAAAVAQTFPARIELPRGWQPEGIAAGTGNQLYVGSIPTGAVVQVDAQTGARRVVVGGAGRRAAIGLKVSGRRLFVAGGGTGRAFVYNRRTGRRLAQFQLAPAGATTFINDVAVTSRGAYFTDSRRMAIYRVPLDLSAHSEITLQGISLTPGNNLNGIVATADGRSLIAVQTSTGRLWRIDPSSGRAFAIDLNGDNVANGDGLLLSGRTLYVVQNRDNRIAVVRLSPNLSSGRVTRSISSPTFDVPTTVARIGGRLYAVNARFATTATARTRYWITRVAR